MTFESIMWIHASDWL